MKTTLHFFTAEYPFGSSENFIENEVKCLSENFDSVVVSSLIQKDEVRPVPENFKVRSAASIWSDFNSGKIIRKNAGLIFSLLLLEFFATKRKLFFIRRTKHWMVVLAKSIHLGAFIQSQNDAKNYYYSFWNNDWALALAVLKRRNKINNFIIRSAGFDIYDERHPGNYLPFRHVVYKHVSEIFPNSEMGAEYIRRKTRFKNKVSAAYLGTTDMGINPVPNDDRYTILSISGLIPLKRVFLIAEIIERLDFKINWIHIGDGPEIEHIDASLDKLRALGHTIDFRGNISRNEYESIFKVIPIDVFMTTSFSEGLPVTVQEAISCGIPVIATDVGGMSEVVNESTGLLLEQNFNVDRCMGEISEFIKNQSRSGSYRKGVRLFWESHFKADPVYKKFCEGIKKYPG